MTATAPNVRSMESIAEIEALFVHGPRIAPDPKHSTDEDRLIAVGRAGTGRTLRRGARTGGPRGPALSTVYSFDAGAGARRGEIGRCSCSERSA